MSQVAGDQAPLLAALLAEEQRWAGPSAADVSAVERLATQTCISGCEQERLLAQHVARRLSPTRGVKLRFDCVFVPLISVDAYLKRLKRLFYCSDGCLLLALVYIDRLEQLHRSNNFKISRINVHRLLLVSLLVAVKFLDDTYFSNEYYAKVGGVDTKELSYLETYFLHLLKYDLYVAPAEYLHYSRAVYDPSYKAPLRTLLSRSSTLATAQDHTEQPSDDSDASSASPADRPDPHAGGRPTHIGTAKKLIDRHATYNA